MAFWGNVAALAAMTGIGSPDRMRAEAVRFMEQNQVPGVAYAVVRDGKIEAQALGFADLEKKIPMTPDTPVGIASCTKQFVGAIILQLIEEGKISLDASIARYLPACPKAWAKITVRDCLAHMSGLPDHTGNLAVTRYFLEPTSIRRIVELAAPLKLQFEPGTQFRYTNTNYSVLAGIIEAVDGGSWGGSLNRRVLDPLGMRSTFLADSAHPIPNRAVQYVTLNGKPNRFDGFNEAWYAGAGDMISSANDLAKWLRALDSGVLFKAYGQAAFRTPHRLSSGASPGYAFGLYWFPWYAYTGFNHAGSLPGNESFTTGVRNLHVSVAILCNTNVPDMTSFGMRMLELADSRLDPLTRPVIADRDLAFTNAIKNALAAVREGKADTSTFSGELLAAITAPGGANVKSTLESAGELRSFELIFEERRSAGQYRIYRILAEKGVFYISGTRAPSGVFVTMRLRRLS